MVGELWFRDKEMNRLITVSACPLRSALYHNYSLYIAGNNTLPAETSEPRKYLLTLSLTSRDRRMKQFLNLNGCLLTDIHVHYITNPYFLKRAKNSDILSDVPNCISFVIFSNYYQHVFGAHHI